MKDYVKIFNKLFQQKSFNKAMEYLDFIKYELDKFPKFLTNYLNWNFFPNARKFLHFLEKDHVGKLDVYINKITTPNMGKNLYDIEGLWSAFMHKKDVWIENWKIEHSTWQSQ